jgi:gamma-glutamyltranspeptidase/glutathione hydrolase
MKGVVVCPQPRAADVGAAVLAKGGNAFDAAVATAFSQMVNDPFMCGIGGMGTLHYYRADEGRRSARRRRSQIRVVTRLQEIP